MAIGGGSSAVMGLGAAGVAALLLYAGIQNKKVGQVLQGSTEETPATEAVSASPEETPESSHNAPNPLATGKEVSSTRKHQELIHGVTVALQYKEKLEREIMSGKLSQAQGAHMFQQKYPYYKRWTEELKEYTSTLKPGSYTTSSEPKRLLA